MRCAEQSNRQHLARGCLHPLGPKIGQCPTDRAEQLYAGESREVSNCSEQERISMLYTSPSLSSRSIMAPQSSTTGWVPLGVVWVEILAILTPFHDIKVASASGSMQYCQSGP